MPIGEAFQRHMSEKDAVTESEIICAQLLKDKLDKKEVVYPLIRPFSQP